MKENKGKENHSAPGCCDGKKLTGSGKGTTWPCFESPSSGESMCGAANRHIKWWKTNRRIKTHPDRQKLGGKSAGSPRVGGCITVFCSV